MDDLKQQYVEALAASLIAEDGSDAAQAVVKSSIKAIVDATPEGEAPMGAEALAALQDEAIALSGLPESAAAVKRVRHGLELARAVKRHLGHGDDLETAYMAALQDVEGLDLGIRRGGDDDGATPGMAGGFNLDRF